MTKSKKTRILPLSIGVDLSDPASIEAAADSLGTTPEMVEDTLHFAQIIMEKAEDNDLTSGQLLTAVMSVIAVLVKDCGPLEEQSKMCVHLFEGLWSAVGLPADTLENSPTQVH